MVTRHNRDRIASIVDAKDLLVLAGGSQLSPHHQLDEFLGFASELVSPELNKSSFANQNKGVTTSSKSTPRAHVAVHKMNTFADTERSAVLDNQYSAENIDGSSKESPNEDPLTARDGSSHYDTSTFAKQIQFNSRRVTMQRMANSK